MSYKVLVFFLLALVAACLSAFSQEQTKSPLDDTPEKSKGEEIEVPVEDTAEKLKELREADKPSDDVDLANRRQDLLEAPGYHNGFYTGTSWFGAMGWCKHAGSKLFIGDFNGDGRSDMLCHDTAGNTWTFCADKYGRFIGRSPCSRHHGRWCNHPGVKLYIGDFNGDKKSDLLCHDHRGRMWMALGTGARFRFGYWDSPYGWCGHPGSELHLGDFNCDGRTDLLCHDHKGKKWVMHAPPTGKFDKRSTWYRAMGWCYHRGARLTINDFNGDGRDDMMCHDAVGYKWVALATCRGVFSRTNWHGMRGWCVGPGAQLFTGRFNGDARADLLCHQTHTGSKWISMARQDIRMLFKGTDWFRKMNWCGPTGQLFIGDFDGNGKDDMLCHQPHTGHKWVALNHHRL